MVNQSNQWNERQNVLAFSRGYHDITDKFGLDFAGRVLLDNAPRSDLDKMNILDYGCGYGRFGLGFSDIDRHVIGVDTSQEAINEAFSCYHPAYHNYGRSFYKIKSGELPFIEDGSLDGAVANFVLCTIKEGSEIMTILKEIKRILKPGAPLVICDPHPENLDEDYVSFRREKLDPFGNGAPVQVSFTGIPNKFIDYWTSKEGYKRLLEKAGYSELQMFEPIIEGPGHEDELFWKAERTIPPYLIIKATKLN